MGLFWAAKNINPQKFDIVLQQEYPQTTLLICKGMDLCAELAPHYPDLWPDFVRLLGQAHSLAAKAGSLQRLDELWADDKLRHKAALLCLPKEAESQLMRRALKSFDDLGKGDYRKLKEEFFPLQSEELQPLSSLSALLVCSNRRQAEEPLFAFISSLPPCLQQEAALIMTTQLLIGCFAAQLLCLTYARSIEEQGELASILTNAGREYDLLERIVEATYPIYLRYYTDSTGGEQLNREEYGMLLFFFYRSRMEEPLHRLAADLDPLPPQPGQSPDQWLQQTMCRAIALRHQSFLEMDDEGLRRCLLALLCALRPHPGLQETCTLLADLEHMVFELKENAFSCRMDMERSRLLDGDFSEANRTYANLHSLEQVETGLQFEEYLGRLFTALGYQVSVTGATADHGVDLILSKNGIRYALQAKFYSGKVGNKAVQEVYSGMSIWGASAAVVVTNSSFTPQASQDALKLGVTLIDGGELHRLIELSGTAAGFAHRFD